MTELEVLNEARARLSDINNWCPRGAKNGDKRCAYETLRFVSMGDDPSEDSREVLDATLQAFVKASERLRRAAYKKYNAMVTEVNDGYGWSEAKSEQERHKMVLEMFDCAIALAQQ